MNMNENWEETRAKFIDQADRFREKHLVWKLGYYTSLLTISGIFIAACAISQPDSEVVRSIRIIVVLVSIICCVLIVSNIKVFLALYDKLGYGKTPNDPEELDGIHQDLQAEFARFQKRRKSRKRKDRAIEILFYINTFLLLYSFVHDAPLWSLLLDIISCLQ